RLTVTGVTAASTITPTMLWEESSRTRSRSYERTPPKPPPRSCAPRRCGGAATGVSSPTLSSPTVPRLATLWAWVQPGRTCANHRSTTAQSSATISSCATPSGASASTRGQGCGNSDYDSVSHGILLDLTSGATYALY